MTYNGNQLTKVVDDAGMQNLYATKEYNDRQNAVNDFSYDKNGNMISDLDREIVSIKYNLLNLPDTIQFKSGHQIINKYAADGKKLSTDYYTALIPIIVPIGKICTWQYQPNVVDHHGSIYVDNLEYATSNGENQNRSLQRIFNSEGYRNNVAEYFYYRKDHLGNNREVWRGNDKTTVQRTQYYTRSCTNPFLWGQQIRLCSSKSGRRGFGI